jgi:aerobic C4-dicarboxylate transport protein
MSECRSLTNLCGNSVASIVVSRWEGAFDVERSREVLNNPEDELAILAEEGEITGKPVEA